MINLVVNGVTYAYPETGDLDWASGATNWASAVTSGTLQKAGGAFTLTADVNFGATYGLKSVYFVSRTANPAASGAVRLANADAVKFRNAANGADISLAPGSTDAFLSYAGVDLVNLTGVQSLTNKTLVNPVISGGITLDSLVLTGSLSVGTTSLFSGISTFTLAPVFTSGTALQAMFLNGGKALVTNAITGSGNVVMSASPTLTGTIGAAAATFSSTVAVTGDFAIATNKFTVTAASGNTLVAGTLNVTGVATLTAQPILSSLTASQAVFSDGSKGLVSNAITGSGNVVMSASPTLTGTAGFANATFSGTTLTSGVATFTLAPILSSTTASQALFTDGSKNVVSNAITGSGSVVMSASPTLTGTAGFANATFSGTTLTSGVATFTLAPILSSTTASQALFTDGSKNVVSNAITGSGNVVMSASPTLTGTAGFAAATFSSTVGITGNFAINTNKFTVTASSGDTLVAGTLAITGVATLTAQPILSSLTASQAVFSDSSKGLVSNAITGSGNVVMSASPTLTGTAGFANATFSGTTLTSGVATFTLAPILNSTTASQALFTDGSKNVVSNAITGSGSVVMSASPTLTGTAGFANATFSGTTLTSGVATFTLAPVFNSTTASRALFTDGSKNVVSNAITGSGNVVMSASPTLTGTIDAASMTLSGTLAVTGVVGFGGASNAAIAGYAQNTGLTGVNQTGFYAGITGTSAGTTSLNGFQSVLTTANASYTVADAYNFVAANVTKQGASAVTNQYGFYANALTSATNNYGFYSNTSSGSNRWNFYAAGTAANLFAGVTTISDATASTSATTGALIVTGGIGTSGDITLKSSVASAGRLKNAGGSSTLATTVTATFAFAASSTYGVLIVADITTGVTGVFNIWATGTGISILNDPQSGFSIGADSVDSRIHVHHNTNGTITVYNGYGTTKAVDVLFLQVH